MVLNKFVKLSDHLFLETEDLLFCLVQVRLSCTLKKSNYFFKAARTIVNSSEKTGEFMSFNESWWQLSKTRPVYYICLFCCVSFFFFMYDQTDNDQRWIKFWKAVFASSSLLWCEKQTCAYLWFSYKSLVFSLIPNISCSQARETAWLMIHANARPLSTKPVNKFMVIMLKLAYGYRRNQYKFLSICRFYSISFFFWWCIV